jgi:hypothetical protein
LEHHSANQFLKAATNLNVVQPKLFQASRQDDLRFSDCTVSVIQILDDTDAAFRISGAELRTVLSATTMLADKPHRLNGRTSVQRVYVLTILPPVTHSRLGYPRSGLSRSDFVLWHFSDMAALADDVRCRGYSGSRRSTRCHHRGVARLLGRKSENISNVDDDCQ